MELNRPMPPEVQRFLDRARVGHLATADAMGRPSVVPICFIHDPPHLFSLIDQKPKQAGLRGLKRIRNLAENPEAAVVVDRWDEDWSRIGWVLVRGRAEVLDVCPAPALALLRDKYPQYRDPALERRPVIRLAISSFRAWGDFSLPQFGAVVP